MTRISTLISLVSLTILSLVSFPAFSKTYTDKGTSTSYTINNGDSLYIASGTFTGTINSWEVGGKITIGESATFNPSSFGYFQGYIINNGQATLPEINGQNGYTLTNYGKLTVKGKTYLGNKAVITNNYGATITFSGAFESNASTIINRGTMNATAAFYIGNNSSMSNLNTVITANNFTINGSSLMNGGKIHAKKTISFSSATSTNNCRLIAEAGITIESSNLTNNGLLWASNAANNSLIYNNKSNITISISSVMKSVDFKNEGTITGRGSMYFTGNTNNNNATIGKSGKTSDSIYVYDATRTNKTTIFDYQAGTVYPNVVFAMVAAPDTISNPAPCALEMSAVSILPVKWNYLFVNLSNNVPAISWGAEQDKGTVFSVQRSYDGNNFTSIATINASQTITDYKYDDKLVNTQAAVVYYRIVATEPTGAQKISDTKTVKFSNKAGITIQSSPNPFTSIFNVSYQSTVREMITIRIISMAGQVQVAKNASVNNGYNSISITEAASLAKGVYMVQLISNNNIISSEKIIKQ